MSQVIEHDDVAQVEAPPRASQQVATRQPRAVAHAGPPDPMELFKIALQKGATVEALKELNALEERRTAFRARQEFEMAIAAARAELPVIVKNRNVKFDSKRTGGTTDYVHEDLAQIASQIDPVLSRHGLSYRFKSRQTETRVTITCVLSHSAGHIEEAAELSAPNDNSGNKNPAQAIASSSTLLSRYTLKLSLGLSAAEVDDDGHSAYANGGASDAPATQQQRPPRASQQSTQQNHLSSITGPRLLPPQAKGETYASWALRFVEAFKTSDTVEELKLWDKLNNDLLEKMFNDPKGRPTYDEVRAAWMKHGKTLSAKTVVGGMAEQRPAAPVWEAPDVIKDYEGFLKWATEKLRGWPADDAGNLEAFWNLAIEPVSKELMPPDKDDLMSEYRRAEQRLGG